MSALVMGLQTIALWAGEIAREKRCRRRVREWVDPRRAQHDWLAKHFGGTSW